MIPWHLVGSGLKFTWFVFWLVVFIFSMPASTVSLRDPVEDIRRYTRQVEFEFVGWTVDALWGKIEQFSVGAASRLTQAQRRSLVLDYFDRQAEVQDLRRQLEDTVSNPNNALNSEAIEQLEGRLSTLELSQAEQQAMVESILQQQASFTIAQLGIGFGGRIIPPLSFKFTSLPVSLIVSPRDVIEQQANIPLSADLDLMEKISIEQQVDRALDVSSLVVNIGGVGTYPTMVLESASISWVTETVIHEWVHNYLTLRPLGLNYLRSQALRTMNETTASILGREIAHEMLSRYYPDFVPAPVTSSPSPPEENPAAFDFRATMHETRVTVDQLLAQGEILEAERYMEEQRQLLWERGYRIRKLNQAYFAFHGAYAARPGGAAGEDPVGEAVRDLWERIGSPAEFLWRMSWMNDFADLEDALLDPLTTP